MKSSISLLRTMRAAQIASVGSPASVLSVFASVPTPPAPIEGELTIAVQACSLSQNDLHILTGVADLVKKPNAFPYTPGGDISGTVVAVPSRDVGGQLVVGDRVVATSSCVPLGGLAQFANVKASLCRQLPATLSYVDGAVLANSAVSALLAVDTAIIRNTDSVLVLGGSGGVGTAVVQLLHHLQVPYIVATSTAVTLLKRLGADAVVNHTTEAWWKSDAVMKHAPFDVIIDCAEGTSAWKHACDHNILKAGADGGRFIAVVWNEWHFEVHSVFQALGHIGPVLGRMVKSCINKKTVPSYKAIFPGPQPDILQRILDLATEHKIEAIIDGGGPVQFTTDGVIDAFSKLEQRSGHGKIVVKVADDC